MAENVRHIGPPADRRALERVQRDLRKAMDGRDFESIDEANAFIQGLLRGGGGRVPSARLDTVQERAQDLVYDAYEVADKRVRRRLANQALALDPDCADAHVILAELSKTDEERAGHYARGVEAGERTLGAARFQEDAGHFWGILETRGYMRASFGLAEVGRELGRAEEAVARAEELLRLDPNDHQGVRYSLIGWLLEKQRAKEAARLLRRFPDDESAPWAWARALQGFQAFGDTEATRDLLDDACTANPYVALYLLQIEKLPRKLPEMYAAGSAEEGVAVAFDQVPAWYRTPGAMEWVADFFDRLVEAMKAEREGGPGRLRPL